MAAVAYIVVERQEAVMALECPASLYVKLRYQSIGTGSHKEELWQASVYLCFARLQGC